MSRYQVARHRDSDTGRERWAVLHTGNQCFYFPTRYGQRAAQRLCERLTKEAA